MGVNRRDEFYCLALANRKADKVLRKKIEELE